jgi:hypothetical protein
MTTLTENVGFRDRIIIGIGHVVRVADTNHPQPVRAWLFGWDIGYVDVRWK